MSIEQQSYSQPSQAELEIEAFKQSKIQQHEEALAAKRKQDKLDLLEELFGDAHIENTEASQNRIDEVTAYLNHLEGISNRPDDFDPLDDEFNREHTAAIAENESFDLHKVQAINQVHEHIAADPKLRRIQMLADSIATLRQQEVPANADAEARLATTLDAKEEKFTELISDYDSAPSTLSADEKLLLTNYLMDRATVGDAAMPVVTYADFKDAKQTSTSDNDQLRELAAIDAADVSLDDTTYNKAPILDMEELTTLADMDAADTSLIDVTTETARGRNTPEDISILENMEAANVSLSDEQSVEDISILENMEAPNVSLSGAEKPPTDNQADHDAAGTDQRNIHPETVDKPSMADTLQAMMDEERTKQTHERSRFNPVYRMQMLFNKATTSLRERRSQADPSEESRKAGIALGAVGLSALAIGSAIIYKNNPDIGQDISNWFADIGKGLGINTDSTPDVDSGNTPGNGSGGGREIINPDEGNVDTGSAAPDAPAAPELLNAPAFNIAYGSGGEALMRGLGVDAREWYAISGDLVEKFPTEFYREYDPRLGGDDIRLRRPGFLNEEAQKLILQRLGK